VKLDRRNRALAGRTVVSVDGVPLASLSGVTAGNPQPYQLDGQDAVICNAQVIGAWRLVAAPIAGGPSRVVDTQGANRLGACGAFWAAQTTAGYRDSRGLGRPDWSLLAVDDLTAHVALAVRTGTGYALAIWTGETLTVIEPDGADSWEDGEISFRDGLLAYRKHGQVKTDPPQAIAPVPGQGVRYARGYLTQWQDGRGLSIRRAGETRGIVISADGRDFGHDMRVQDDGLILVVSSSGEGELPGELRRYVINPVLDTVNGEARPPVDLLAAVDEPPADVPTIAPWPCRVAVFYHANSNPSHPLPRTIRSEDGSRDLPIVSVDDALVFATITGTAEGTQAGFDAAVTRARQTGLALGAYRDAPDYAPELVPAVSGVDVVPIVQAYPWRKPDGLEPLAAAMARVEATVLGLQRAGHARVGIATAYYRQIEGDGTQPLYHWPLAYTLTLAAAVADLARRLNVRDLYAFEWSRADGHDGIVSRAEFTALFTRLLEAAQPVHDASAPSAPSAPDPLPDEDDPMRTNPTDALTYSAVNDGLQPRAADRAYTDGSLDAYRLLAEGTPLAVVLAGNSQPTQQPIPACPYVQWAAASRALLEARVAAKKGTGYTDGVLDTFRRFGGERWPLEYILADIEGEKLPARPWGLF
jgi:hypothetical protein